MTSNHMNSMDDLTRDNGAETFVYEAPLNRRKKTHTWFRNSFSKTKQKMWQMNQFAIILIQWFWFLVWMVRFWWWYLWLVPQVEFNLGYSCTLIHLTTWTPFWANFELIAFRKIVNAKRALTERELAQKLNKFIKCI